MLSAIMHELNYVGVMAMECFVTPAGLLINELAPRAQQRPLDAKRRLHQPV
jgi:phosphoribosylaminoimidazole carboxylase (NCAIR synthetase)